MPASKTPPHDRGHLLWTAEEGASRLLLSSIDRWTSALLMDDAIDSPMFDNGEEVEGNIYAKEDGIIVGTAAVDHLIQIWAPSLSISWQASDGKKVSTGEEIAKIRGPKDSILRIERTILNILGQLSGIATETKKWSSKANKQIACTRKTIWGLLDKWAVHLGGGLTHRLHMKDAKMIKENDLETMSMEGMENFARIAEYIQSLDVDEIDSFIEIEVRNEKEAVTAAAIWKQNHGDSGKDFVIMLDNMGPETCRNVVQQLEDMDLRDSVILEASGNIVYDDLESWFECGLDVLSTSALNRGTKPLDISMIIGD